MSGLLLFLVIGLVGGLVLITFVAATVGKKRPGGRSSRGGHSSPAVDLGDIRARWSVIMAAADTGAAGLKSAINDADKLFDNVLRAQGVRGETMGERLKAARPRFGNYSTYDGVWRAHKVRNSLAHDVSFTLVPSQAREALAGFERGLRELGAL